MNTLQQLSQANPRWSLEEFVRVLNDLLPQFLPVTRAHTRVREDVTPRLVRHYTSQGMLDEPLKKGREARYIYRHLLQMLVVRRLMTEGYGANAIDNLGTSKSNAELEALLQGGAQLTVTPANPALEFLQQIKKGQNLSTPPVTNTPAKTNLKTSYWQRIEIISGLEIHIREDFSYPRSPQEQQNLLQYIAQKLAAFSNIRRQPR